MKVKELIDQLQKQNPEDEIHIWVDDEVGAGGSGEFEKYYASKIDIMGHLEYYENEDDILSEKEIEENIKAYENYPDEQEYISKYYEEINSRKKLEGTWIKIQP